MARKSKKDAVKPQTGLPTNAHIIGSGEVEQQIITDTLPGPQSRALHTRATKHYCGLSGQVKLFPVAFEKGQL